jgi:serine protease AprX
VINLAYGTTGVQSYQIDPLAHAIENAWRAGIVVVVAAGNDGNGNPLRNPAIDPYVIAVGATTATAPTTKPLTTVSPTSPTAAPAPATST